MPRASVEQSSVTVLDGYGPEAKRVLGKERLESLDRIDEELRTVKPARWPVLLAELVKMRRDRYQAVKHLNQDIIGVFEKQRALAYPDPWRPPRVDLDAVNRLGEATGQWEKAQALARAAVTRWPVLDALVERCDTLVRQWWVYAQNDPYCRHPDRDDEERCRAFDVARDFVEALREAVATRTIGQPTWRVVLLRVAVGRRTLATLDHQNALAR